MTLALVASLVSFEVGLALVVDVIHFFFFGLVLRGGVVLRTRSALHHGGQCRGGGAWPPWPTWPSSA